MRYSESLRYLNSFLNLERITAVPNNRQWNLDRMHLLLDWFGHPEKSFFSILIVGTKGKGSTGFMTESILKTSGIPCGFYSSPHLEEPLERIRIHGEIISRAVWAREVSAIRKVLDCKVLPERHGDFTYFEILTLLAALIFKKEKIRIAIFEAGMGGRLDTTRLMAPKLVLVTPIHLDHEAILGDTIEKIAQEKSAVIGRGMQVVTSPQVPEARKVLLDKAKKEKVLLWQAAPYNSGPVGLCGDYQKINAGVAYQAAMLLGSYHGETISQEAIREGLRASNWPGRFELVKGSPEFLLDGAHNPISVEALVRNLKAFYPNRRRLLLFATSRDKRSESMLKTLSGYFTEVILTRINNPRSQEIQTLISQAQKCFRTIYPAGKIEDAMALAGRLAMPDTLVVATGSFYLIGEMRKFLRAGGAKIHA